MYMSFRMPARYWRVAATTMSIATASMMSTAGPTAEAATSQADKCDYNI